MSQRGFRGLSVLCVVVIAACGDQPAGGSWSGDGGCSDGARPTDAAPAPNATTAKDATPAPDTAPAQDATTAPDDGPGGTPDADPAGACTPGNDETCNDAVSETAWGSCNPDATCSCLDGAAINPATGKCRALDALSCAATGASYCTAISGWSARCFPDGRAAFCPSDLPQCLLLASGDVTCVLAGSAPCDPASHRNHCSGDALVQCVPVGNGQYVTWPTECGDLAACQDLDTGEYDVPGPCTCVELSLETRPASCVAVAAPPCEVASWPRSCVGNELRRCLGGIVSGHDCGPYLVCQEANGTAGCAVSPLTACSSAAPPCFSDRVAQVCCAADECLPGYLTVDVCAETYGPASTCDATWHHCVP